MLFRRRNITPQTDAELVAMLRGRDSRRAQGALFERYALAVMGVCLKYLREEATAEDAVMDIFGYVFLKAPDADIRDFQPWLRKVASNHCLMILRKKKREIPTELIEAAEGMEEQDPLTDERLAMMPELLNELGEHQRQCIRLFYLEEKSYQEISELTKLDFKAVKSHIQNGKRNLSILFRKRELPQP
jgi:RNA polymerase sigma-70 factor, ECF subfamily